MVGGKKGLAFSLDWPIFKENPEHNCPKDGNELNEQQWERKIIKGWGVAQWWSTFLTATKPRAPPLVPLKKKWQHHFLFMVSTQWVSCILQARAWAQRKFDSWPYRQVGTLSFLYLSLQYHLEYLQFTRGTFMCWWFNGMKITFQEWKVTTK